MSSPVTSRAAYDALTVRLHWIVAAGVLAQWGGAHLIDTFPPGPQRVDARSVHIVIGATLLGLVAVRLWWRGTRGVRFETSGQTWFEALGRLAHGALYLGLVTTLALGVTDTVVRHDSLFGLAHVPSLDLSRAARHALDQQVVALHRLSANLLLSLAIVHACAGFAHHLVFRDDVLTRMVPGLRSPKGQAS